MSALPLLATLFGHILAGMNIDMNEAVRAIGARAENLYLSRRMLCAESILTAVNQGLSGPLSEDETIGLASGLSAGLGGSGCLCGAAGGSVLAIGLMLGRSPAWSRRSEIRDTAKTFNEWFRLTYGSTCCRVLSKKAGGAKAHFDQCARLTAESAAECTRLILERRPDLIGDFDQGTTARRDTMLGILFRRLLAFVRH